MIEIQEGLLKEDRTFLVNGVEHHNSRLYAKNNYHFYDMVEYEEQKTYYEEEKARRLENNESISDLILEKSYMTFVTTPLTDNEEINARYRSELI